MPRMQSGFLVVAILGSVSLASYADQGLFTATAKDVKEWEQRLKPTKNVAPKSPVKRVVTVKPAPKAVPSKSAAPSPTLATGQRRLPTDEARYLIVPDEKYLLRFEDEEGAAQVAQTESGAVTVTFSPSEVEKFQQAVDAVSRYRAELKSRCSSVSTRGLGDALDRYLSGVASFYRKGLPLIADISESNEMMTLVVNRSLLVDAPVLIHRYFKYKRARFKETIDQFNAADKRLVQNLETIANVLKVTISESQWKRTYSVREAALESLSIWPREVIFEAANSLSDVREMPCVVKMDAVEPSFANTGIRAPSAEPVVRQAE